MKILLSRRTRVLATFKPEEIRTDWKNKIFKCNQCDCNFQLESEDEAKIFAALKEVDGGHVGTGEYLTYFVFCPEGCGNKIEFGDGPNFPTPKESKQEANRIPPYGN